MPDDESIVQLLGILYAAPTDPPRWTEFLRQLCATCGVSKAALIAHDHARQDHRILAGLGDELKAGGNLYERHYWQFDEWTIRLPKAGTSGRVKLGEEIWPEPAFRRSVFYNEFLNQHDICQVAAIPYLDAPGILESVGIYRGSREESFGREQTSVLKMIAPHLQTALETRRRLLALETRIPSLETTLDSMSSAVVLIDLAGKAIFVNRQARAILAQTDGIFLHKGRLTGRDSQQTANLRGLIDKAIATSVGESAIGGGAISLPRAAKRPIQILISPIPATDTPLPGKAAAAVFLDDPELQLLVPADILRALFGLTPAEARLALSVLKGHSLLEAAELNRVSRETVKSQMASIFLKTGAKRQGELVRLLSRLAGGPRFTEPAK